MSWVIEIRGVSKTFVSSQTGNQVRALYDVSLTVEPGRFVSIVGPSGCGKSTLLRIVAGLLQPDSGSVRVSGQDVQGPRADVAMVFQQPLLLDWMSVIDNVLLPARIRRLDERNYRKRAQELLDLLGIGSFARYLPTELSGGMQQRVAIARALLLDPPILLLDEPFSAVDALTREQLNLELLRLWGQSGRLKSILLVTHSIAEAVFLSDSVFVMSARPGRVLASVEVSLPRPRVLGMLFHNTLGKYVAQIRALLGETLTHQSRSSSSSSRTEAVETLRALLP